MRLGINLCEPRVCRCWSQVDARGLHGLTCKVSPGYVARHESVNTAVRAFSSAGIPVTKEPTGLARGNDKRPDGMTLSPWQFGKPLTWDVTVQHTLADSYVSCNLRSAGAAVELAASRKSAKCGDLLQSYLFQAVVETLGSMNSSTSAFFSNLGGKICPVFDDVGDASCLF